MYILLSLLFEILYQILQKKKVCRVAIIPKLTIDANTEYRELKIFLLIYFSNILMQ